MTEARTAVRLQGDPSLMEEVEVLLSESGEVEMVSSGSGQGGEGLDFDIATLVTVVGLVSSLFFDGAIVPSLWRALRRHKGSSIVIETPLRTVKITSTEELTEEQVRQLLATLA